MTPRETPNPHSISEIAKRLKLLRTVLGNTQAKMANLAGISGNAWANYEAGTRRIGVDEAIRLCSVLGVTLDWIYRGNIAQLPVELVEKLQHGRGPDATSLPEIAKRLLLLRMALNKTPATMAAMINASRPQTWGNYEQALRRIRVPEASRLCNALGVTLDWIYHGKTARLPVGLAEKLRQQSREARSPAKRENG